MRFQFDLVNEPWIPCVRGDSGIVELGLLGTLEHAHEVEEVHDPSPLVTAALHRLLLAILHRCFGPATLEEWVHLWERGRFDGQVLQAYFNRWRHRFDLFHTQRPFYQVPGLPHTPVSAAKLGHEIASGNNPTLFDHTMDSSPPALAPGAAARLVVACQNFHLGGTISRLPGESPSAAAAPLAAGAVVLFVGKNLFETLMLNLIQYRRDEPWEPQGDDDLPAWEQDLAPRGKRAPKGYLDYLTWQSRHLYLMPEVCSNRVVVRQVVLAAGNELELSPNFFDPQMAYFKGAKKNPRPQDAAWLPLRFREDRALWRDSTALFGTSSCKQRPPKAREWLSRLVVLRRLPRSVRYHVGVYGLSHDRAKIHLWRHERMPVPVPYLTDQSLVELLYDALSLAERTAGLLEACVNAGTRRNENVGGNSAAMAMGAIAYWSSLHLPFMRFLEDLPCSTSQARARWAEDITSAAMFSFERATSGLAEGRFMKGVTLARQDLEHGLWKATRPYKEVANDRYQAGSVCPVP